MINDVECVFACLLAISFFGVSYFPSLSIPFNSGDSLNISSAFFFHNSFLSDVDLSYTDYSDVFHPLSRWYWEGRQLVEAVSLEETFEVLPLFSPHCPVVIPASLSLCNCGWSPVLDSKGFYLGSTKAQLRWNADETGADCPPTP